MVLSLALPYCVSRLVLSVKSVITDAALTTPVGRIRANIKITFILMAAGFMFYSPSKMYLQKIVT